MSETEVMSVPSAVTPSVGGNPPGRVRSNSGLFIRDCSAEYLMMARRANYLLAFALSFCCAKNKVHKEKGANTRRNIYD